MIVGGLRRWSKLDARERGRFLRAVVALGRVSFELRFLGFPRVLRGIEGTGNSAGGPVTIEDLARARHYARWLEVASRHHLVRARCLQRSLALHRWLRGESLPSRLRIGVRKEGSDLRAHAWVELADEVVSDPPAAIVAFSSLTAGRPAGPPNESE